MRFPVFRRVPPSLTPFPDLARECAGLRKLRLATRCRCLAC